MTDQGSVDVHDRFSNRVDYYVKYRPGYPQAVVELLKQEYKLNSAHQIADIGAGVGHSAKLFCEFGAYVYAVEPNKQMHDQLLELTRQYSNLAPQLQSAENTNLEPSSIDFIVCAQSFHWFNHRKAKTEFSRILNTEPDSPQVVVLMWNSWKEDTAFGKAYTKLVEQYSTDYAQVSRGSDKHEEKIKYIYRSGFYSKDTFANQQKFDLEGLKGRYMSSSYAYLPEMEGYNEAMTALEAIYEEFKASDGLVTFEYDCNVYHGKIKK